MECGKAQLAWKDLANKIGPYSLIKCFLLQWEVKKIVPCRFVGIVVTAGKVLPHQGLRIYLTYFWRRPFLLGLVFTAMRS